MKQKAAIYLLFLSVTGWLNAHAQTVEEKANYFNDPFVQATNGDAQCARPAGPEITKSQQMAESHYRVERGTSCYRSGRCRLPNSYLYDKEIIPRVKQAIEVDGRFEDTSIWVEGQRRWVWLKGCVQSKAESEAVERLVRDIDDVEAVINQLVVTSKQ
ncbi:BON domain-containing protein [Rhodoferax sp.]|uniref:BON domain-containing protein n=1 Tax=Rhodoferax sp. TaxID=50421 RepID=UPI002841E542|nr:BON domain-containing protein [Rhodoferax sp.]MDR3368072.1 BON domain-containing protein [Rhodoferax sp.]